MEQYLIKGGKPLVGEVEISGAKNSALGILAAAIMCNETVTIRNLPDVNDINVFLHAIQSIGADVNYPDLSNRHVVEISGKNIYTHEVDNEYIRKIRASYYLIGAMLGKYGEASVAMPGGCAIGSRPIDQHEKGFKKLGASIQYDGDMIRVTSNGLTGNAIYLDMASVGATINVMLAASMAEGQTTIENAAREPHVVDVAQFLNQMGADIRGAGTHRIKINGVPKDSFKAADHEIIPDQIEAGTFMCAAAATGGDVTLSHVIPPHLESITAKLLDMGVLVEENGCQVRVIAPKRLTATNIETLPYPGFPTDMQAQFGTCLALAEGESCIKETIFESRFKYINELNKMGADIRVRDDNGRQSKAFFNGVEGLVGASVSSPDLRAGAALVIAGLAAKGETRIRDIQYIQRGYEHFEEKIRKLGGMIERIDI